LSFTRPIANGQQATVKPEASGTLFFRVNDSAAGLNDNRGTLTVNVIGPQ
jgi:hypothetical protein